jgi:hypothetical protein
MDLKRSCIILLMSAFVLLLALGRFCPETVIGNGAVSGPEPYVYRIPYLLEQIKDPLALIKAQANDHNSNALRWRILFPCAAFVAKLGPASFLQLPRIGAGMLLGACAVILFQLTKSWGKTFSGLVLVAASYAFLVGTEWISLDPFFLILVLIFVFAESSVFAVLAAALAPWADERFVFFLPSLFVLRHSLHPESKQAGLWAVLATVFYLAVRAAAALKGETSISLQLSNQSELQYPVFRGWYFAFGLGWALVLWSMGDVAKRVWKHGAVYSMGYVVALLAALVALAFLAGDTTRAIAICLPFLLAGIRLAPSFVLHVLAALNFVLPTACYVYGECRYLRSCFSW